MLSYRFAAVLINDYDKQPYEYSPYAWGGPKWCCAFVYLLLSVVTASQMRDSATESHSMGLSNTDKPTPTQQSQQPTAHCKSNDVQTPTHPLTPSPPGGSKAAGKKSEVPWPDMQHACYFAGSLQTQFYITSLLLVHLHKLGLKTVEFIVIFNS